MINKRRFLVASESPLIFQHMTLDFKYKDEQDKCYGITGVAMSVVIWDVENLISAVYLDSDAEKTITYTPQLKLEGNAGISPQNVWNKNVEDFRLSMGMILSNVLCRTYVYENKFINHKTKQHIFDYFIEEGKNECDLERDEVEALLVKNYDYLHRIFSHPEIQRIAHDFARLLTSRRHLSQVEIIEALQPLNML